MNKVKREQLQTEINAAFAGANVIYSDVPNSAFKKAEVFSNGKYYSKFVRK